MISRHLILRAVVPAITAAALVVSGASATPVHDAGSRAARHAMWLHHSVLPPDADAAAHAATIRGVGAALAARARA